MNNPFAMMGGMPGLAGLMGMGGAGGGAGLNPSQLSSMWGGVAGPRGMGGMGGAGGGSGEIKKQTPDMVNITDGDMEDLQSEIEVKKERLDNINCPFKSCKEKLKIGTFNNAKFHLALQ